MTRATIDRLLFTAMIAACLVLIAHAAWAFPHCGEHSCIRDGSTRIAPERQIYCHNPVAIDGDTIDCAGTRIRIWGIDAPEANQKGGEAARIALSVIWLETAAITCIPTGGDKYGRTVAWCYGQYVPDIGRHMVRFGYAHDYVAFSRGYYWAEQEQAKAERLGLWQDEKPIEPWVWRARNKK